MDAYGLDPQVVMTVRYSWGGRHRQDAPSVGNYIGIDEPAGGEFGKVDVESRTTASTQWYEIVTWSRDAPAGDPIDAKLALARGIVRRSTTADDGARRAEEHFTRVVREGQAPDDVPEIALPNGDPVHLPAVLVELGIPSTSEARRLITQGAVRVNGEVVNELDVPRARLEGALVQAGKRRYGRLTAS